MRVYKKTSVTGFAGVKQGLKGLKQDVKTTILTDAVREGAKIVHSAVISNVPTSKGKRSRPSLMYGHLKDNIRLFKLKLNVTKNKVVFRVGTTDGFWGYFLEYGTGRFFRGLGGQSKGAQSATHIEAKPWFRPASDQAGPRAVSAIKTYIIDGIDRARKYYGFR